MSSGSVLRVALMSAVLGTLGSLAIASGAFAQGKWERKAPFPDPSEEVLGIAAGGKMYVFAGLAPVWKPKALAYEYDPAVDKWTEKKKMALPSHHVAFAEYQGKIYAFGGFVPPQSGPPAWVPIDNSWEYDPVADNWKALAAMPTRRGAAAAAVVGGKVYVIGGATTPAGTDEPSVLPTRPHLAVGAVEEYDIATSTWRTRRPMPTARNHLLVAAVNGKIYAIGGRLGAAFIGLASDTDVVEEYDPAIDLWQIKARMPTARSALAGGVHGGRIYVAGGEMQDTQKSATFRAFEGYDPATNSWTVLPGMPVSRHGMAGGVTGDQLHLVSGDVQSAGSGLEVSANYHDVFTFGK
jgi:N-acetylneuraminic acid mutarotase